MKRILQNTTNKPLQNKAILVLKIYRGQIITKLDHRQT